ncbi:MAG: glutamyl-tRNA reductase [Planctomycetaceae bacterium]
MNVQVVYCNHQTAALQLRERLAFSTAEQLDRAYGALRNSFPESEVVVVSTCNRVELYTAEEEPDASPSREQIAEFFSEFHEVPRDDFLDDLLRQTGPEAVRHLFEVACSLDSMVLGEPQIVAQIKDAYEAAQRNDACGPLTNALFQGALRVSARVRSETKLAEGRVSIASVAVGEFGKSIFDHFGDKTVLVIGAGEMAEETLRYLRDEGVGDVVVVNRNADRAETLAREFGGTAEPLDRLDACLARADVIVSTTGADEPIVDAARFAPIRKQTHHKPVFVLDLAAPRDFDPAVGEIDDNVFLYDIDDLEATCRRNREARSGEIERARLIVAEEAERFMHDYYHQATGPIIKRLRDEWHAIRKLEMELLKKRLSHLSDADVRAVEKSIERIINKLLHPPLTALRDEAKTGTPHGLLHALKQLFGLED